MHRFVSGTPAALLIALAVLGLLHTVSGCGTTCPSGQQLVNGRCVDPNVGQGACCINNECVSENQIICESHGGVFWGIGVGCFQGLCQP